MSLRLTTDKHRVLQHVSAFALAWVVASFLFAHVLRPITVSLPQPGYHVISVGKGEDAVHNLLYLASALHGGHAIVVLGSSELDRRFASGRFAPNVFFPAHHLAKVFTYGQGGFETLGMYGLLSSVKPHLSAETRLVVMLSPIWFNSTDLPLNTFNDNFNDSMLLQLYLYDDQRAMFHDYIEQHRADFLTMTDTQHLFLNDPESTVDWDLPGFTAGLVNSRAYAQRVKLDIFLSSFEQADTEAWQGSPHAKDLTWEEYEKSARTHVLAHINPDYWVQPLFYRLLIRKHGKLPIHSLATDMNPEPEMNGLRLLLQMLERSKVKALFVMQGLNPRVYDDVTRYADVDARVKNLCREYGMEYMDMYDMPYEEGMLVDGVHPSDLAWVKVDQRMAEFFHL